MQFRSAALVRPEDPSPRAPVGLREPQFAAGVAEDLADLRDEQVVLTRGGKAVALLIGLDEEQEQLGQNRRFWNLIAAKLRSPAPQSGATRPR